MESTLSRKYQLVVPLHVRAQMNIRPGQKMSVRLEKGNRVVFEPKQSNIEVLAKKFGGRKLWGNDPAAYISKERISW
jgi:AbrB family looped-hinge helix DNA binding protein